MWNFLPEFIRKWFAVKPEPRKDVAAALSEDARAAALKEARFLFSEGAWVRDMEPGEEPKEEPEIGQDPIPAHVPGATLH